MRNKIFTRIIITTLLCAFLTFSVGKVTRVSAVGTTAAIAGTAFILTGAVYLSYVALTQGEMVLPAAEEMNNWLGGIGRKVSQYSSGAAAYQDIYQGLLRDPTANVIDGVWTWTQDRLKAFANDFADTRIISDMVSYTALPDEYLPTTNYNYDFTFVVPQNIQLNNLNTPLPADYISFTGARFILFNYSNDTAVVSHTDITTPVREYYDGNWYYHQQFINGEWQNFSTWHYGGYTASPYVGYYERYEGDVWGYYRRSQGPVSYSGARDSRPIFADADIYDATTGETIQTRELVPTKQVPQWLDPDNNNRPIIPWVPIPDIPTGVPIPPGYTAPPQWGFPLQDLLDLLEELARGLINIGVIGELINEFAGQHGDNYYLEYNDGDTNYYTYYQPTIFDNDTEYVTYNIDITDEQDKIPVDLNTIQLYTNNRYLAQIKESAVNGSTMLRDLAVFWYDVDPEVTYIVFGCCILILIGAFTGKLGHS